MDQIRKIIRPRERDLGGFSVRRILPYGGGSGVGPFVFLDHMGPARFDVGKGIDVRPHPHIGLATVTFLFDGEIVHRDSLGCVQPIRPGDVNWMVAGRGIVHSERTAPEHKARGSGLHGMQAWIALPRAEEERAPAFVHHPASTLPQLSSEGTTLTVIAGSFAGERSPAETLSPMFYLAAEMAPGGALDLPAGLGERAAYVVEGAIAIGSRKIGAGELAILTDGADARLTAESGARTMLLGGTPLDGPRHIWWNFVSSSEARIEQAKADWKAGRFGIVPGDAEFIPLPEG